MDNYLTVSNENPQEKANLLSRLTFKWFTKLCFKCKKEDLKIKDLYKNLRADQSNKVGDLLEQNWQKEIDEAQKSYKNPSLYKAIRKTFLGQYMTYGFILLFQYAIVRPVQPILLALFIKLFMDRVNGTAQDNIFQQMSLYGSLILLNTLVIIFLCHHTDLALNQMGMKVRIACCSLIYRKILRLSQKSLDQSTAGQVINLLSNDVNRFDLVAINLHHIWIMPIVVTIAAYCIWLQVGVSALTGIGSVLIFTIVVHAFIGKLTSKLRLKIAQRADDRVRKMAEVISGIQVIKMYGWEKPFAKIVKAARAKEIETLSSASYLRGIVISSFVYMQRFILFSTVVTYVLLGNTITADKVFSMSLFFNLLQLSMAIFYPLATSIGAETLVSIKRLEDFLNLDEKYSPVITKDDSRGVNLKNIYASWNPDKKLLRNISVQIVPRTLCAIVGPVGAGKSSLLQLLLGELIQESGAITIGGNMSYASQDCWLFASTVRKNILFGQKYDRLVYRAVVKVCALEKDFQLLPMGDQTMVGERGVSLSGGQKARINLARAVYKSADIYLLDDPLSAVDTQVGKQLFQECIMGYLKTKTRILVTHQLQYLKKADHIVVLNDGGIEAQGTFAELSKSNYDFIKLLIDCNETDEPREVYKEEGRRRSSSVARVLSSSLSERSSIGDVDDSINENEEVVFKGGSSAYWEYARAGGNVFVLIGLFIFLVGGQAISSCSDFWLAYWTAQESEVPPINSKSNLQISAATESYDQETFRSMMIYTAITLSSIVILTVRSLYYYKVIMNASKNLHNKMFSALLQSTMRFFDLNPSGRILNRFSRDMGVIDEILPRMMLEAIQLSLVLIAVLVLVCVINVYMMIVIAIIGIAFHKLRRYYVILARELKHLEGITRSPVFSHVSASLNGLTTIRAAAAEDVLKEEFDLHQDTHTSAWYLTLVCISAFGLWLDLLCFIFASCVIFGFIILSLYTIVDGSYVGLAVSQALILTGMVQYGIREVAEVVSQMTSVERILEYTKLEQEGPQETPPDVVLPLNWPYFGEIIFKDVFLYYSKAEPPVLRNLNFTAEVGQKIGIVGRTGAGKSSLISALFRLAPVEGSIIIDGIDTKTIGLNDLRKKISIIPQEPVLFSATLRYNLDPFEEFSDAELWTVLEDVKMKNSIPSLGFIVQEGGSNFSVGQRQLLCLARAILRHNKILVLDEATANVDPKTDALIQTTIRDKFRKYTVLTIAHRLNTIMDADKVLVMDSGTLLEYDHPHTLLQNPNGAFTRMVEESSPTMAMVLKEIARQSFVNR